MEAVVGAEVARRDGLASGRSSPARTASPPPARPTATHPYQVVGVLAPTGTVVDRLVLTSVESVWHVHEDHAPARPEITALLVRYRTPLAAAMLPRADERHDRDAGRLARPTRARGCSTSWAWAWRRCSGSRSS